MWSLFPADTGYFGGSAGFMINYRVMDPEGNRVELWEPSTGLHA